MPRVARANIDDAGLGHKVEIRVGAALDTLQELEKRGGPPFDFVFIDADKENNPHYLDWAIRLGRPGTTIVMDNVVWEGAVLDASWTWERPGNRQRAADAGRGPEAGRHRHPDRGVQRLGRLRPGARPVGAEDIRRLARTIGATAGPRRPSVGRPAT